MESGTPGVPPFRSSAAAAVVITVVTAITVAVMVAAAAAGDQDEDDDQPQAGAVIVSVVKPHESHLALSLFYASGSRREPDRLKNSREAGKIAFFTVQQYPDGENGGFHV